MTDETSPDYLAIELQMWLVGKLIERCDELNISLEKWADESKVNKTFISSCTEGTRNMTFQTLYRLMRPLKMTIQLPLMVVKGQTATVLPEFNEEIISSAIEDYLTE